MAEPTLPIEPDDQPTPPRPSGPAPTGPKGYADFVRNALGSLERPGDAIGPYKLLETLGEGGFGIVWLAERQHPFFQQVALKIIKPGMDSRSVIARFEQERQALAVMDHPNVARVLDGGVTPSGMGGRPYFVMEYVRGEPITTFCDRHAYTTRQRLELFIPVCQAVQHAHLKGIIHRDLKPSNILVAITGDRAVPKVIDFGVAKAVSHTLASREIFTEHGFPIGTPEYMSPEQAEMGALDIDARTDVYSLGVVLYELLTTMLPFEPRDLRSKAYTEMQRIIRDVEPPTPSRRLTSLNAEADARIARTHQTRRDALVNELRRELEWIPLKAMRKDRVRRYDTPDQLAEDILRYLRGQPLRAGPESTAYILRKFIKRRRLPLAAALLLVLTLAGGAVGTTAGMLRANRALEREAAAKVKAQQEQRIAEESLAFIERTFRAVSPSERGPDITVKRLFDAGAAQLQSPQQELPPQVAGRLHRLYGEVYRTLNDYHRSTAELTAAIALLAQDESIPPDQRLELLAKCTDNALDVGDYTAAVKSIERSEALLRQIGSTSAAAAEGQLLLHEQKAWLRHELGDWPLAEHHYRAAMALAKRAGEPTAALAKGLAILRAQHGDGAGALAEIEPALAEIRARAPSSTLAAQMLMIRGRAHAAAGDPARAADDLAAARDLYVHRNAGRNTAPTCQNAEMQLAALAEDFPAAVSPQAHKPLPGPTSRFALGPLEAQRVILDRDRAAAMYAAGRPADGARLFAAALDLDRLRPADPTRRLITLHTQCIWADSLRAAGNPREAAEHAQAALEIVTPAPLDGAEAAPALLSLARALMDLQRHAEAEPLLTRLKSIWEAQAPGSWTIAVVDAELAACAAARGDRADGPARLAAATTHIEEALGKTHPFARRAAALRAMFEPR